MSQNLDSKTFQPTRRQFFMGAAAVGAGLSLSFHVPVAHAQAADTSADPNPYNAYVMITPDNKVQVLSAHMEMGQGAYLGVATLLAEELEADRSQLEVIGASGNPKFYANLAQGGEMQITGGSSAMASSYDRYRKAGALARTMLVNAAAKQWRVPTGEIIVDKGVLSHKSGKRATFGEMADAAGREPMPATVLLKPRAQWKLIGSETFRRLDSRAKSTGKQDYTIDLKLPGMLTAMVAHPPRFGGKVKSFDASKAKAVKGVVDVVQISTGVAVVAQNTWAAMKGREALKIEWDESAAEKRGSADLLADYLKRTDQPGMVALNRGDVDKAMAGAAKVIEATYQFPYLAHAPMEPLDAVARMTDGTLEVWGGHQGPDFIQGAVSAVAGVKPENVKLHVMSTGGSFGRRGTPDSDIAVEAVETAKAIGWKAPVKVLWNREDVMRGGRYRPIYVHKTRVGLDKDGAIVAWMDRVVGQAMIPPEWRQNGLDGMAVEGMADTLYALPNFRSEAIHVEVGVPVLWWRSVGATHNAYVVETMLDEVARQTGKDPVALRRSLLKDKPRHLAALDLAATKAGWGEKPGKGVFRGVALHESFKTVVAQVADIRMDDKGGFKVERVVAAANCGTAINPDQVRAQMEGGIGFGLGAILHEELTLTGGLVDQGNFDTYQPLRIEEMPKVEAYIVPSEDAPTGIGEPGVPPIGPAVANALASATGERVRILPFSKGRAAAKA